MSQYKHIQFAASLVFAASLELPLAAVASEPNTAFVDSAAPPQHMVQGLLETTELSDPEAPVDIPDAVLRRAVEKALGKGGDEPITHGDMTRLSTLRIMRGGVDALTGLEHAVNLSELDCQNGGVSDLTPLARLEALRTRDKTNTMI